MEQRGPFIGSRSTTKRKRESQLKMDRCGYLVGETGRPKKVGDRRGGEGSGKQDPKHKRLQGKLVRNSRCMGDARTGKKRRRRCNGFAGPIGPRQEQWGRKSSRGSAKRHLSTQNLPTGVISNVEDVKPRGKREGRPSRELEGRQEIQPALRKDSKKGTSSGKREHHVGSEKGVKQKESIWEKMCSWGTKGGRHQKVTFRSRMQMGRHLKGLRRNKTLLNPRSLNRKKGK